MVDRSPARRSPARYLVPLALAATVLGTYLIVHHALRDNSRTGTHSTHSAQHQTESQTLPQLTKRKRSGAVVIYVVRPGDTLSQISQRTHVSIATLQVLNPHMNPNALQVGQRLRLRR